MGRIYKRRECLRIYSYICPVVVFAFQKTQLSVLFEKTMQEIDLLYAEPQFSRVPDLLKCRSRDRRGDTSPIRVSLIPFSSYYPSVLRETS